MSEFRYVGSELELFSAVHNWKSYWSGQIAPFVSGDVLEVGAGIGANTAYLSQAHSHRWVCLEPDPQLVEQLSANVGETCEVACGTVHTLQGQEFDTILYIDVLEHIEDDRKELEAAAAILRTGGHVVVLAPAHQRLYTPFDEAIGHFRRYDHAMLRRISPAGLQLMKMWYLDSAGLLLSTANRLFLRQSMPTREQLRVWDSYVIPVSKVLDRCFRGRAGKSIVAVWRKP
jgi:SAM-dependent methyltransferase